MRIIWATPQMARFFLPRHIESFCRKMLFNSCIFLKRLARHGNTHVEPEKMQRPWPTLFLSTNLQQVLGRGIHHLRWHSITGQFLDFLVAEMTQFDVFWWFLGNMDYLVWQGLHNSFSRENIVYFWSSIFESFFRDF